MKFKMIFLACILLSSAIHMTFANVLEPVVDRICSNLTSCSSCIAHDSCSWCVMKSICTKQACGNDNAIYPEFIPALMAGPDFCPRIDSNNEVVLKSGENQEVLVKVTQLHLLMSYSPWHCRYDINGKEIVVDAVLAGDAVSCGGVALDKEPRSRSVNGQVKVFWDHYKPLDGSMPIKLYSY